MQIQVLLFGIVADLVGEDRVSLTIEKDSSVKKLKKTLCDQFEQLKNYHTYALAVNEHYAQDDFVLKDRDVVAIIPPVSGG